MRFPSLCGVFPCGHRFQKVRGIPKRDAFSFSGGREAGTDRNKDAV